MVSIVGAGDEAVVLVELGSVVVDGVDDDESRCGDRPGSDRSGQRIPQELAPEALAVEACVECEAGQE